MKNKLWKQREVHHRTIVFCALLFIVSFAYAQVGVGNTSPQATLDIKASNHAKPSNVDGNLIPSFDAFPLTNPTAAQDGMVIFLTTTVGFNSKGFYYWNEVIPSTSSSWIIRLSSIESLNDLSDAKSDVDVTNDGSSIFIGIDAELNGDANSAFGFSSLDFKYKFE